MSTAKAVATMQRSQLNVHVQRLNPNMPTTTMAGESLLEYRHHMFARDAIHFQIARRRIAGAATTAAAAAAAAAANLTMMVVLLWANLLLRSVHARACVMAMAGQRVT